jgi:hypothetical protein
MADTEPMPLAPHEGAQATEADEETVLRDLYGPPDGYGVFREVR